MTLLSLEGVSVTLEKKTILSGISFTLEEGGFYMIAGPNGAGKTTIVQAIAGSVPYDGKILYRARDVRTFRPDALARHIGILAQTNPSGFAFTVSEVVRLGRYAYGKGLFHTANRTEDAEAVRLALELTGMEGLQHRKVNTLSGGEVQRMFLAQLFAQNPEVMVLDEPANHLDPVFQQQVFSLVDAWRRETGRAVLSVVHDLSIAKAYGTDALLLNNGQIVAKGRTADVFTPENLQKTYDMDVAGWMRRMLSQWT